MKKLLVDHLPLSAFMILCMMITSCDEKDKTHSSKESIREPKEGAAGLPEVNMLDRDPTFVVSSEITSPYGPRSITRSMLQDKNGDFWFASWEGIIHYDGEIFTNVTLKEGLRQFHVMSVLDDQTGNLWFGMVGGGVYRYNGESYTLFTTKDGLAGDAVFCMLNDRAGNMWFGTGNGVSRYDGRTFTSFTTRDGLADNSVYAITQDRSETLWFGTDGGVNHYTPATGFTRFTHEEGKVYYPARSIVEDQTGKIWIGGSYGLYRYDPSAPPNDKDRLSLDRPRPHFTSHVFEDQAGNLWLSEGRYKSPMTLTRYDGNSFTTVREGDQIFSVIEDNNGNIWFGTELGVRRYDGVSFTDFLKPVEQ